MAKRTQKIRTIEVILPEVCIDKRGTKCRYIPHSLNKKMHWAEKNRWTSEWKEITGWSVQEALRHLEGDKVSLPLKKKLELEIVLMGNRPMDKDNRHGACKPIIDGLTEAGIIKDDSDEFIEYTVTFEKVKKKTDQKVKLIIKI